MNAWKMLILTKNIYSPPFRKAASGNDIDKLDVY